MPSPSYTFTALPPQGTPPTPRQDHTAVTHDGAMFVFGGRDQRGKSLKGTFRYDVAEQRWSALKTRGRAPEARYGHCAVVFDGQMFVYGGVVKGKWPDERHDPVVHALDLKTLQWCQLETKGTDKGKSKGKGSVIAGSGPAVAYASSALFGSLWFLYGGAPSQDTLSSELRVFDLANSHWLSVSFGKKSLPPEPVSRGALVVVGKTLYRLLGHADEGSARALEMIDLGKVVPEWDLLAPPGQEPTGAVLNLTWTRGKLSGPGAERRTAQGFGRFGNELVLVGGQRSGGDNAELTDTVLTISLPSGKTQVVRPQGAVALTGHSTSQQGNQLLVFGGARAGGALSDELLALRVTPVAPRKQPKPRRASPVANHADRTRRVTLPVATVLLVKSNAWDAPASFFRATTGKSNHLNWLEAVYPDIRAHLKRGDIVEDVQWSGDRAYGIQFYDGKKLVPVYTKCDDYGTLSAEFKMFREFHPRYWHELVIDDRYAPGEKSKLTWHSEYVCQLIDEEVLKVAARAGVRTSEQGPYVVVEYQGLEYAVLQSCPRLKEGRMGVVYSNSKLAKVLGVDFVVGPEP